MNNLNEIQLVLIQAEARYLSLLISLTAETEPKHSGLFETVHITESGKEVRTVRSPDGRFASKDINQLPINEQPKTSFAINEEKEKNNDQKDSDKIDIAKQIIKSSVDDLQKSTKQPLNLLEKVTTKDFKPIELVTKSLSFENIKTLFDGVNASTQVAIQKGWEQAQKVFSKVGTNLDILGEALKDSLEEVNPYDVAKFTLGVVSFAAGWALGVGFYAAVVNTVGNYIMNVTEQQMAKALVASYNDAKVYMNPQQYGKFRDNVKKAKDIKIGNVKIPNGVNPLERVGMHFDMNKLETTYSFRIKKAFLPQELKDSLQEAEKVLDKGLIKPDVKTFSTTWMKFAGGCLSKLITSPSVAPIAMILVVCPASRNAIIDSAKTISRNFEARKQTHELQNTIKELASGTEAQKMAVEEKIKNISTEQMLVLLGLTHYLNTLDMPEISPQIAALLEDKFKSLLLKPDGMKMLADSNALAEVRSLIKNDITKILKTPVAKDDNEKT